VLVPPDAFVTTHFPFEQVHLEPSEAMNESPSSATTTTPVLVSERHPFALVAQADDTVGVENLIVALAGAAASDRATAPERLEPPTRSPCAATSI
jgi:hypothetical protein